MNEYDHAILGVRSNRSDTDLVVAAFLRCGNAAYEQVDASAKGHYWADNTTPTMVTTILDTILESALAVLNAQIPELSCSFEDYLLELLIKAKRQKSDLYNGKSVLQTDAFNIRNLQISAMEYLYLWAAQHYAPFRHIVSSELDHVSEIVKYHINVQDSRDGKSN